MSEFWRCSLVGAHRIEAAVRAERSVVVEIDHVARTIGEGVGAELAVGVEVGNGRWLIVDG